MCVDGGWGKTIGVGDEIYPHVHICCWSCVFRHLAIGGCGWCVGTPTRGFLAFQLGMLLHSFGCTEPTRRFLESKYPDRSWDGIRSGLTPAPESPKVLRPLFFRCQQGVLLGGGLDGERVWLFLFSECLFSVFPVGVAALFLFRLCRWWKGAPIKLWYSVG